MKTSSRILGTTAFLSGFEVQDFPLYGAERRGAPMVACVAMSAEKIMERGYLKDPDLVLISDESLLYDSTTLPLAGLGPTGKAFVNSAAREEDLKKRFGVSISSRNLTQLALRALGKPVLSAAMAGVASKMIGLSESKLKEAVDLELKAINLSQDLITKNIELALEAHGSVPLVEMAARGTLPEMAVGIVQPCYDSPLLGTPVITQASNSRIRKTGNWRVFKPEVDEARCTGCRICYLSCPDSVISIRKGKPVIDYDNCKGCLVCVEECPIKAIKEVIEAG